MVDHLKPLLVLRIICRANVCDVVKGSSGVIVEKRHDVQDPIGSHAGRELPSRPVVFHRQDGVWKRCFQRFKDGMHTDSVKGKRTYPSRLTPNVSRSLYENLFALNLLLQLEQAIQQRFRPRGTARHIDIDGHNLIHALHDAVAVVMIA